MLFVRDIVVLELVCDYLIRVRKTLRWGESTRNGSRPGEHLKDWPCETTGPCSAPIMTI
ncbi:protein of unknown function [Kyrpidia spormannii]|uniref:Uncharacterized protein n=1 Tax=Kyrpidia spormannii TaxID=2055160 RepID=A0ACA8ZCT9_9BACL|nr:protein of unknown function [Kyrpidia spormannii]